MMIAAIKKMLDPSVKVLKRADKLADEVIALEPHMQQLTDEQLQNKTLEFKERIEKGESLDDLLVEAFAVVREASTRVLGMTPFKVQIIGGIALHGGNIAEMRTGEGKTLTSTMPAYLNALSGKGVHIITVNEYLASRDAREMGELYRWLGLTVGLNLVGMSSEEKKAQYACDIMYSTNNELGFDYLRDHMVLYAKQMCQDSIKKVPKVKGESKRDERMRELTYLNLKWFMITLLNRKDRMTMANSLEGRVPYADKTLVEYAYNIPADMKLLHGREKGLLRESMRTLLPDEIIDRKKSPYPKTHNPIYTKAVCKMLNDIAQDPNAKLFQIVDKEAVINMINTQGRSFTKPWFGQLMTGPQVIAYLIQLETWLNEYNVKLDI